MPCRCLAGGFTSAAIPRRSCVSANTKDKELNEGFSRQLNRGLQNAFNPAVLLLITSETVLLTCLELRLGGRCPELNMRDDKHISRTEVPLPCEQGASHPRSGSVAPMLGTFICRFGVFFPS